MPYDVNPKYKYDEDYLSAAYNSVLSRSSSKLALAEHGTVLNKEQKPHSIVCFKRSETGHIYGSETCSVTISAPQILNGSAVDTDSRLGKFEKSLLEAMALSIPTHILLVPLNDNNQHWMLLAISFKKNQIINIGVFDPLHRGRDFERKIQPQIGNLFDSILKKHIKSRSAFAEGMRSMVGSKFFEDYCELAHRYSFSYYACPMQTDVTSCGVLVVDYIKEIVLHGAPREDARVDAKAMLILRQEHLNALDNEALALRQSLGSPRIKLRTKLRGIGDDECVYKSLKTYVSNLELTAKNEFLQIANSFVDSERALEKANSPKKSGLLMQYDTILSKNRESVAVIKEWFTAHQLGFNDPEIMATFFRPDQAQGLQWNDNGKDRLERILRKCIEEVVPSPPGCTVQFLLS